MFSEFILPGILVGIGAAISPGPILILTISETMRGGLRSGFTVSLAPSILDLIFVPVSIILAAQIESFHMAIGILSFIGAGFLLFLAYQNLTADRFKIHESSKASISLTKAIVADFFNPHLYIFWFSVAIPIFAKGNLIGSILFAASLSICTFIGHFSLALLTAALRGRLLQYLHWILRILSVPLVFMALVFMLEGVRML